MRSLFWKLKSDWITFVFLCFVSVQGLLLTSSPEPPQLKAWTPNDFLPLAPTHHHPDRLHLNAHPHLQVKDCPLNHTEVNKMGSYTVQIQIFSSSFSHTMRSFRQVVTFHFFIPLLCQTPEGGTSPQPVRKYSAGKVKAFKRVMYSSSYEVFEWVAQMFSIRAQKGTKDMFWFLSVWNFWLGSFFLVQCLIKTLSNSSLMRKMSTMNLTQRIRTFVLYFGINNYCVHKEILLPFYWAWLAFFVAFSNLVRCNLSLCFV